MSNDEENIENSNDPNVTGKAVTAKERLQILRRILYCGGIFYFAVVVALIILRAIDSEPMSSELSTLITFLGSTLTTVVGVIIGSSLNNK